MTTLRKYTYLIKITGDIRGVDSLARHCEHCEIRTMYDSYNLHKM